MKDILNWPAGFTAAVLLAALGSLALRATRDHRDTLRFQTALFLTAFALRFAGALAIYGGGLVNVLQDEDSQGWAGGVTFLQRWVENGWADPRVAGSLTSFIRTENTGYQTMLGVFFILTRLTGRLSAAALTAAISAFGIVFTYRTARIIATERAARVVAGVITGLPLMLVWSSQTLKEPVVIAIEAFGFYALMRLGLRTGTARHVWLALAAFVLVAPFRFYIAYALGVALVFGVWRHRAVFGGRVAARVAVTLFVIATTALITRAVVARERPGLERVQRFRESVSPGGTAIARPVQPAPPPPAPLQLAPGRAPAPPATPAPAARVPQAGPTRPSLAMLDVRKPWQLPLVALIGSIYALLAPFPWQFGGGSSLRLLFTAPDMLLWWSIFFGWVVRGVWRALRTRALDLAPLVVFLVMIGGLYSLLFANVGIAYRQRAQLVPPLLLLTAAGLRPRERTGV